MTDHYKVEHIFKALKKLELKEIIKSKLVECFVMSINPAVGDYGQAVEQVFSFEQEAELLKLQMEQKRVEKRGQNVRRSEN